MISRRVSDQRPDLTVDHGTMVMGVLRLTLFQAIVDGLFDPMRHFQGLKANTTIDHGFPLQTYIGNKIL